MGGKESGGSMPFEGMSHEAMLAWLDQANSGTVQGAADRLAQAAKEIRKIADELKVRPQWVEWKGAGADAFRTWSADLANATLRLGDFSEGSATWLGHASDAIASAQAAIPRDKAGAQANLDAARAAHNDPDAAAVSRKSAGELAALAADEEKVRQEAVAQMRKLGQAYQVSATQMNGLERPRFPPPPSAIVPESRTRDQTAQDVARPGAVVGDGSPPSALDSVSGAREHEAVPRVVSTGQKTAESPVPTYSERPAAMEVDSTTVLPHRAETADGRSAPVPGGADDGMATQPGAVPPPLVGGEGRAPIVRPVGPGRDGLVAKPPQVSEPGPSRFAPRRLPSGDVGIIGGRPVPPSSGEPLGTAPRGTVVGAEAAGGRGVVGPAAGAGPAGQPVGRPGGAPARGTPVPNRGVSGGSARQAGSAGFRSSSSTGAGPERGGVSGGTPTIGRPGTAGTARGSQAARPQGRRAAGRSPGYLTEDEETWLRGADRAVPPVIE